MRTAGATFQTALSNAPSQGLHIRKLLMVRCRDRTTQVENPILLWSGSDAFTVSVLSGATGINETRTYQPIGVGLQVSELPRVSDLTVQALQIGLPHLNPFVLDMVKLYEPRFAKCEIHTSLFNALTGAYIASELEFVGEIDGAPSETPQAGQEGSLTLSIVSDAIRALTRSNPAKRSYQHQKKRLSDDFAKYAGEMGSFKVPWGE